MAYDQVMVHAGLTSTQFQDSKTVSIFCSFINVKPILLISERMENNMMIDQNIARGREDLELPFFSLTTLANATNNFSSNNKLGEGGFGPVYKVTLQHAIIKTIEKSVLMIFTISRIYLNLRIFRVY